VVVGVEEEVTATIVIVLDTWHVNVPTRPVEVVMEGEGEDMVEVVVEEEEEVGTEVEVVARTVLAPLPEVEVVVSHDLAVLIIHVTALVVAHRPERHHVLGNALTASRLG